MSETDDFLVANGKLRRQKREFFRPTTPLITNFLSESEPKAAGVHLDDECSLRKGFGM